MGVAQGNGPQEHLTLSCGQLPCLFLTMAGREEYVYSETGIWSTQ